jgi:hypothetical protein
MKSLIIILALSSFASSTPDWKSNLDKKNPFSGDHKKPHHCKKHKPHKHCPPHQAIPEPSSAALVAVGLVGLLVRRKR